MKYDIKESIYKQSNRKLTVEEERYIDEMQSKIDDICDDLKEMSMAGIPNSPCAQCDHLTQPWFEITENTNVGKCDSCGSLYEDVMKMINDRQLEKFVKQLHIDTLLFGIEIAKTFSKYKCVPDAIWKIMKETLPGQNSLTPGLEKAINEMIDTLVEAGLSVKLNIKE